MNASPAGLPGREKPSVAPRWQAHSSRVPGHERRAPAHPDRLWDPLPAADPLQNLDPTAAPKLNRGPAAGKNRVNVSARGSTGTRRQPWRTRARPPP